MNSIMLESKDVENELQNLLHHSRAAVVENLFLSILTKKDQNEDGVQCVAINGCIREREEVVNTGQKLSLEGEMVSSPMTIEVTYFRKNERWYGYRFKLDKFEIPLQVYGPNPDEAHKRLLEILDFELGKGTYALDIIFDDSTKYIPDPTACQDGPTRG